MNKATKTNLNKDETKNDSIVLNPFTMNTPKTKR